jgi:SET domain-containing protein
LEKRITQKAPVRGLIRVGKSRIEGRGVFAKRTIPKGTRIIEYRGKRRTLADFCAADEEAKTPPIVAISLDEDTIIDPTIRGNHSRFINHSCEPNCDAYAFDRRVYIYAGRDIVRGEELTFDYQLRSGPGKIGEEPVAADYPCRCGSKKCRGTMLSRPRWKPKQ